jgi:hypothetical protein
VTAELETRWNKAFARVAGIESKIAAHDAAVSPLEPGSLSLTSLEDDLDGVECTNHRCAAQEAHRPDRWIVG